jgi:DNA-binding XRE family transcriptional regulator
MTKPANKLIKEAQKWELMRGAGNPGGLPFPHGYKLRRARAEAGLTQAQVAACMGTTQPTVARWESGVRRPSLLTLMLFAAAVDCWVDIEFVPLQRKLRWSSRL